MYLDTSTGILDENSRILLMKIIVNTLRMNHWKLFLMKKFVNFKT